MNLRAYRLSLFIISVALPSLAAGQAGRAELSGVIRDSSGLAVPGAGVQAEDQSTMSRYSET